jgi:hypothetical protein
MLSRIPCGGYDQRRIFVNSGQGQDKKNDGLYRFEAAAYSVADSSSFRPPFALLDVTQTHVPAPYQLSAPVLEKSLERTACESKYLEVYWTSLLPHGQAFPPQAAHYSTTSWTSAIQDLYHEDSLVRVILLANALTLTAQRTEHPSLIMQGRRLYGLSLQGMARSLLDKRQKNWGKILAACGLLTSYEVTLTCVFPMASWFDWRSDLRAHSGANSYSSMLMDDIHGYPAPRGWDTPRVKLLLFLLVARKASSRDKRTNYLSTIAFIW